VLLLLAGFAPFIAIKMFHFAGDSLHSVHAQAGAARAGTEAIVAAPRKVNGTVSQGRLLGVNLANATGGNGGSRGTGGQRSEPSTPRPAPGVTRRSSTDTTTERSRPGTEPRTGAQSADQAATRRAEPAKAATAGEAHR
jgi:hypothetical protein